ncbi:hypothetical protein [Burkholderia vietnamiensis]|uniref:hypothetical protein n=1 Tax=Burkholderia vietnamiensis TaxID=60552 RepID=UPI0007548C07|nr:hypothetical protein [Burkholderia vietnamiensis]KVF40987.1 hypothetical protein WJ09_24535 [Burkholderia vietnamiensis]
MRPIDTAERFLDGVLYGMVIETIAMLLICVFMNYYAGHFVMSFVHLSIIATVLTLILVEWRLIMLKTVWKLRFGFIFGGDVNVLIIGRVVGVGAGFVVGLRIIELFV